MDIVSKNAVSRRIKIQADPIKAYEEVSSKKFKESRNTEELRLLQNPEDTPENPLTFERLMEWLAWTGWVYGYVKKKISPMDANLWEDYAQSVWLALLELKPDYVMGIWYKGKGKFVNFLKKVINIQIRTTTSSTYHTNKHFHHIHKTLTDDQWTILSEGENHISYEDPFPMRYSCPSGNRSKMVVKEIDHIPAEVDPKFLTDSQIYLPDEIPEEN